MVGTVGSFECFLQIFLNFVSIISKSLPSKVSTGVRIYGNFSPSAIAILSQPPHNCSSSVNLIAEKNGKIPRPLPGIFSWLISENLSENWKDNFLAHSLDRETLQNTITAMTLFGKQVWIEALVMYVNLLAWRDINIKCCWRRIPGV